MTRYLLIAAALLSLPPLTDWLVDHNFRHHVSEPVGYSRQQRDAMSRLVARATKPVHGWNKRRAAAAVADIWGITSQELDSPVNIWGRGKGNE